MQPICIVEINFLGVFNIVFLDSKADCKYMVKRVINFASQA
jgi:hypothetical protein